MFEELKKRWVCLVAVSQARGEAGSEAGVRAGSSQTRSRQPSRGLLFTLRAKRSH